MPPHLALRFFGPPQIRMGKLLINPGRRTVIALLAYLSVTKDQHHTREFLSSLFWADLGQIKAFTNLRHTLWEAQQSIGDGWLIADRQCIHLNQDAHISVDVDIFQDRKSTRLNSSHRT